MYALASVTKTITATALMVLHERHKLDLERPVNDYLVTARVSDPQANGDQATVRQIMDHTSGLGTFNRRWPGNRTWPADRAAADEVIRRYGVILRSPGKAFDYSNLGYAILGETVARVSGKSYADFVREEVFRPLGMNHSSIGIAPGLEKFAAPRYLTQGRSPIPEGPATSGASDGYASAHDLAQFGLFHLKAHLPKQKTILSDASIDEMQNWTVPADGNQRYGLGWWVNDLYGYRGLLGQGGNESAQAWLQLIPSEGIVVVALANNGNGSLPKQVIDEVLSVLLPRFSEQRQAAVTSGNQQPPRPNPLSPSPGFVGNWTGLIKTYKGDLPLTFSIAESGEVHAKLASQEAALTSVRFTATQRLTGLMTGNLGTDDDNGPGPYDLRFWLTLEGQTLNGAVTTQTHPGGPGTPSLSFWVELRKVSGEK